MNKTIVPRGSVVNMETLISDTQDFTNGNFIKRFKPLLESFGVITDTLGGSINGVNLKLSISSAYPAQIRIQPGQAFLNGSGDTSETIKLVTDSYTNLSGLSANTSYLVKLRYVDNQTTPVPAINGFLYDPNNSNRNTKSYDSFTVVYESINTDDPAKRYTSQTDSATEFAVGIIRTTSDSEHPTLLTSAWNGSYYASDSNGIVDLRAATKLNVNLFNNLKTMVVDKPFTTKGSLSITNSGTLSILNGNYGFTLQTSSDSYACIKIIPDTVFSIKKSDDTDWVTFTPSTDTITFLSKVAIFQDQGVTFDSYAESSFYSNVHSYSNMYTNNILSSGLLSVVKGSAYGYNLKVLDNNYGAIVVKEDNNFSINKNDDTPWVVFDSINNSVAFLSKVAIYQEQGVTFESNVPSTFFSGLTIAGANAGINKALNVLGDINISGNLYINNNLISFAPTLLGNKVLNLSVVSIVEESSNYYIAPTIQNSVLKLDNTSKFKLTLSWGSVAVGGSSITTSNVFSATTNWPNGLTRSDLVGNFIYFPTLNNGTNLKIIDATGTGYGVLTLQKLDGTLWVSPGFTLSAHQYAVLHSNADKYHLTAVPLDANNNEVPELAISSTVIVTDNLSTSQTGSLSLQPFAYYNIYIQGEKAGNFTQRTPYANNPVLAQLPVLAGGLDNGAIALAATPNGFRINITGWETIKAFEVAYTANSVDASFTDPGHTKIIVYGRTVDITTSSSTSYHVAIRPIIMGQQVGSIVKGEVVSGAGGNLPQVITLVNTYVNFGAYKGTLTVNRALELGAGYYEYYVTFSNSARFAFYNPSDLSNYPYTNVPADVTGELLTDYAGNTYSISYVNTYYQQAIIKNIVQGGAAPVGGLYTIGATKPARQIYKVSKLPTDFIVTRITVDCYSVTTTGNPEDNPVNIRFYQEGKENLGDSLSITGRGSFATESDFEILGLYGDRNLIIDLWDPDNPAANGTGFLGLVTVYGIAKQVKTTSAIAIAAQVQ